MEGGGTDWSLFDTYARRVKNWRRRVQPDRFFYLLRRSWCHPPPVFHAISAIRGVHKATSHAPLTTPCVAQAGDVHVEGDLTPFRLRNYFGSRRLEESASIG